MKRNKALLILAASFLLVSCGETPASSAISSSEEVSSSEEGSKEIEGLVRKDIEVRMVSHFGEEFGESEFTDTALYSDYWFLDDSKEVNYELALMSSMVDGASYPTSKEYQGEKVIQFLDDAGYHGIQLNEYYAKGIFLEDSMGSIIGRKSIKDYDGKEYTLLAVFPRNAGYRDEWMGNFNLGAEGIHDGFLEIRDETLRFMKRYIADNNITGELKVWSAGYSRGGVTANLLGAFLAEDVGYFGDNVSLDPENLFVYTIGTPAAAPTELTKAELLSVAGPRGAGYHDTDTPAFVYAGEDKVNFADERYKAIHNFVGVGDFVPKLPPQSWNFTRFGVTENVLYGSEAFLKNLEKLSPETADTFIGGKNYETELPNKTFDIETCTIVDVNSKQSANAMIDERLAILMGLAGSREGYVEKGYDRLLGGAAAIFGTDWKGFFNGIKENIGAAVKAGVLNYLAYAQKQSGLSEAKTAALILKSLFAKTDVELEAYTDQQFLADFLDYLSNDYQQGGKAVTRANVLSVLIPAPYGKLYMDLLNFAKDNQITVKTVDEVVLLLAKFVSANKTDENVIALIETLAKAIPAQYASFIPMIGSSIGKDYSDPTLYPDDFSKTKAALVDILDACANGVDTEETQMKASYLRYMLINMIGSFGFSGKQHLIDLLANGTHETDDTTVTRDPVALDLLLEDILDLALPKDSEGKRVPLAQAANDSLVELLDKGRTEINGAYVDILKENPEKVREIIFTVLCNPGENYDVRHDIESAVTFIDKMQFLSPAHSHEMYMCYLKTQIKA